MPLTRRRFLSTSSATGFAAAFAPVTATAAANASPAASAGPAAAEGITANVLAAAEKIAGLAFTDAQRAPLLKGVAARSAGYADLRASPPPNHVFPALTFDPRVAGVTIPSGAATATRSTWQPPAVRRPDDDNDLAFLPVAALAGLLRSRQVTSRTLTELALTRLRRFDPELKAVVTLTEDRALRQADAADAELRAGRWRGPLHGVPWGAKDLFAVRGYPTTWGAAQFRDRLLDEDAEVVRRLDTVGAVLVAKLSLGALANNDAWFGGQTKCPWNPDVGSSGSSAGSCAAVAAGLVPFALGTETLGSIVSPSTRNGVTGFRPSYGRVSRAGAMALAWSMDKIGPIARTAEDCALVFAAIQGADPADPTAADIPFPWEPPPDLRGRRIGLPAALFEAASEWQAAQEAALATLRHLGAELVPLALPAAPLPTLRLILTVEAAAAFDDFTRSGEIDRLLAPRPSNWANAMREARYVPAVEYVQANRHRTLLVRDLERTLAAAGVDVWVSPPAGAPLVLTNLTGHPTVCVPIGYNPVPGQPAGSPRRQAGAMTFHARLHRDELALHAAHAFQGATDWHRRRPPVS